MGSLLYLFCFFITENLFEFTFCLYFNFEVSLFKKKLKYIDDGDDDDDDNGFYDGKGKYDPTMCTQCLQRKTNQLCS